MRLPILVLTAIVVLAGGAEAVDFTEDFESFDPGETDPDQDWYNFNQGDENGSVNDTLLVTEGNQSFLFDGDTTGSTDGRTGTFRVEEPHAMDAVEFTVQAQTLANQTGGSQQVVKLESGAPVRKIVEFYIFCRDDANPQGCEFRVRFDHVDSTGQVLVNTSQNDSHFNVRLEFDWINSEYRLFVDGQDDGTFPFLELPQTLGRVRFSQYRGDVPWEISFDNWTLEGTVEPGPVEQGDMADGLKSFANDIRFTTTGSLFFLGFLTWIILMAAIVVPMLALGRDNTVLSATAFFGSMAALWLVHMEWWPDWIAIAMIIGAAAIIALTVRRSALGIRDASSGASLVIGSLGYFVIASALLAFGGYGTDTVNLPTNPVEQTEEDGQDINDTQSFAGAVTECIFSGGVFTFGLVGDCSQETQTSTFKRITDSAGRIFGWVQASVNFVYQLLSFRFPIPTIFNLAIIGPPAAGLAAFGVQVIRGS